VTTGRPRGLDASPGTNMMRCEKCASARLLRNCYARSDLCHVTDIPGHQEERQFYVITSYNVQLQLHLLQLHCYSYCYCYSYSVTVTVTVPGPVTCHIWRRVVYVRPGRTSSWLLPARTCMYVCMLLYVCVCMYDDTDSRRVTSHESTPPSHRL